MAPDPALPPLRFTLVVPTRGRDDLLNALLDAIASQSLERPRWDVVVSFDGGGPSPETARRIEAMGALTVTSLAREGPGAARNRGAARATGDFLAFTEDDCVPDRDWLARALERLAGEPGVDVLEGATLLPDGRPARRREPGRITWLPTNLFVRRTLYERIGGYCERFFDRENGVYFREDSDFGFTAVERGARVAYDPAVRVTHPREHPGWLDPIRWARRYEMDPLLEARHPVAFREQIEVARWGPFRLRRPFVRACTGYVVSTVLALTLLLFGEPGIAAWFAGLAVLLMLAIWGKWRFDPRHLPAAAVVPVVLLGALVRGRRWASEAGASSSRQPVKP